MFSACALFGCADDGLTAGQSDAAGVDGGEGTAVLTVEADGEGWTATTADITRAGETLESLRQVADVSSPADDEGFGIYCSEMGLVNQQVVWNDGTARWYYGDDIYWPRSLGRKYVSFNNSKITQSEGNYFTVSEGANLDTKFNNCVYRGVTFSSGLKMEQGVATTISWTSTDVRNVVIVQSNWSNYTIRFDDAELLLSSATTIPGGRVYTIPGVAAGSYTITSDNGETGIFYVAAEECFTVYAYAPYKSTPYTFDETAGTLTFATDANGEAASVDLLYAVDETVSRSTGDTHLAFKHALSKLSFGSLTNNTGRDIYVTDMTVSGNFHTAGVLNMKTNAWGNTTTGSGLTIRRIEPTKVLTIANKETRMLDLEGCLLMPGPTATVQFGFTAGQSDVAELTTAMFHRWDGVGADAGVTALSVIPNYSNNIGNEITGEAVVYGTSAVYYLDYADLTGNDKLIMKGTVGMKLRVLLNRVADGGALTEVIATIGDDGMAVVDLSGYPFVHLNAIKTDSDSPTGTITAIEAVKTNKASYSTELVRGVNMTLNISVGQNFEVVIGGASRRMNNE